MKIKNLFFLLALAGFMTFGTSCSKKTGCPMNEQQSVDMEKDKNKRSKSGLFPKGRR